MKFDLDTAWRDVKRLAGDNRTLLFAIAGIFVFVPYAALLILLPSIATLPEPPEGADIDAIVKAFETFYAQSWWAFLLVTVITTIGQLAMLALVERKPNPTVGEAIGIAAKAILPAWLALLIQSFAINIAMLTLVTIAAVTGLAALTFVGVIGAFVLGFYLTARLSLILPIMAAEGQINPVAAIRQSWSRTRGNGGRLLAFYLLVGIGLVVSAAVASMLVGVLLALLGTAVAEGGGMIFSAFLVTVAMVLLTLVLAAAHRQFLRLERSSARAE